MTPGDPNGLEFKGMRTDPDGVSGAVFGPAGVDFPFRAPDPEGRTMDDFLAELDVHKREAAGRTPLNAHDVEEAMRPYLGEVYEAEQDDAALGSRPTRLERAYRAALDHLLELNGVTR